MRREEKLFISINNYNKENKPYYAYAEGEFINIYYFDTLLRKVLIDNFIEQYFYTNGRTKNINYTTL